MKRLTLSGIAVLLLVVVPAPIVKAETPVTNSTTPEDNSNTQLAPFDLVSLANQGYFTQQGIPSGDELLAAYKSQRITAEDIVKSAIALNRLSPQTLNDQEYLNAVDTYLSADTK